jgi:hypothetical protein
MAQEDYRTTYRGVPVERVIENTHITAFPNQFGLSMTPSNGTPLYVLLLIWTLIREGTDVIGTQVRGMRDECTAGGARL